jgi:hypothetical protein
VVDHISQSVFQVGSILVMYLFLVYQAYLVSSLLNEVDIRLLAVLCLVRKRVLASGWWRRVLLSTTQLESWGIFKTVLTESPVVSHRWMQSAAGVILLTVSPLLYSEMPDEFLIGF